MRFPPANIQLRRAQLVLMMVVLVPTVLLLGIGVVLLAIGSTTTTLVAGVLVLALCTTGITGYILVSIFVGKGASLVQVQNDFVSSVSHELRTPLTSIRLFLESLQNERLSADDRRALLPLLVKEVERLDSLVGRVLELSRLQSGRHSFASEAIPVSALFAEAVAVFDASTLRTPTPIDVTVDPALEVFGDRATLVRAVSNLLINAWKYTGDVKRIELTASRGKRWVTLTVLDNGIGIARSEQREMFEQFTRGKAAVASGAPGEGLGLAFVRAIVRGHRGKLELASRPDGGTEVDIRLRIPRAARRAAARAAHTGKEVHHA